MNADSFELTVTTTILLRRVRKKRFQRKPRNKREGKERYILPTYK